MKEFDYVIIGGGCAGLSLAYELEINEKLKHKTLAIIESRKEYKRDTAAGASGIACGVVRNNYFQPAMRELMAHSVSVWESDPKGNIKKIILKLNHF